MVSPFRGFSTPVVSSLGAQITPVPSPISSPIPSPVSSQVASPFATVVPSCWRDTPCNWPPEAAFPGEWESNIFAPPSRDVAPTALLTLNGNKIGRWPSTAELNRNQTGLVFDFGLEVGGLVTIDYTVASAAPPNHALGLAFSEAKDYIGTRSDSSNGIFTVPEGALSVNVSSTGEHRYTMPLAKLRGGFRYMTTFLTTPDASVEIHKVSVEMAFQPTWPNLRAYQGYFHSNDDLLNKIWYSGAYTLQANSIPPTTGRAWPSPQDGSWLTDGVIGPGQTILVDGAKRDRTVWPGDLGVAVPSAFYSTGDLESTRNGLQALFDHQNSSSGQLPFAGPPLLATDGATYHMWTMIGLYNYVFFADDVDFLRHYWPRFKLAMTWALQQVDPSSGMFFAPSPLNDWGRLSANGTITSAQALLYHTLVTGATLREWVGDTSGPGADWLERAANIRNTTLAKSWDASAGAFFDAPDKTAIHPQDGNSLAVMFGLVDGMSPQASSISAYLAKNWSPIGAVCEELPGEISPFISSLEIQAHFLAGRTQRALDLIRRSWGWYLNNPKGTQSTMIEGYLVNGTFGYRWNAGYANDFSFTSHAHAWSTGPVTTLSEYSLGFRISGRAGSTWELAPQPGDLTQVEGGFTTKLGKFSAAWEKGRDGSFTITYQVPENTHGEVRLPVEDGFDPSQVTVNGKVSDRSVWSVSSAPGGRKVIRMQGQGGTHSIAIR